jgi:hypothetical protein
VSKLELLEAYVAGTIGRRAFIQGLVDLGMGVTTAASYAVALQPMAADAKTDLFYLTVREQCKNYIHWGFATREECLCYVTTGDPNKRCKAAYGRRRKKKRKQHRH